MILSGSVISRKTSETDSSHNGRPSDTRLHVRGDANGARHIAPTSGHPQQVHFAEIFSVAVNVMRDVDVDKMCAMVSRGLLLCMADNPEVVTFHLLFCTKNLERIGDHTTNIAEAVYYMVQGEALLGERPKADLTALATMRIYSRGSRKRAVALRV